MQSNFARKQNQSTASVLGNIIWMILVFAVAILFVLKFVVFQNVTVVGQSMEPNYQEGNVLLVNQLDKTFRRGQVVAVYKDSSVAKSAREADFITGYTARFKATFYLKRVIGLPGEQIEIIGSKVIIYNSEYPNGVVLDEAYIASSIKEDQDSDWRRWYYPKTKIPEGRYFLLGDNRTNSTDSRSPSVGTFPEYSLFGQESFAINPFHIFKIPQYKYLPIDSETADKQKKLYVVGSAEG
jgi:signal peptidase I